MKEIAQEPGNNDEDWFSTPCSTLPGLSPMSIDPGSAEGAVIPAVDNTPPTCEVPGSCSHARQPVSTANTGLLAVEPYVQERLSSAETSLVPPAPPKQEPPLTKKQRRRIKKAQGRRGAAASPTIIPAPPPAATALACQPANDEGSEQTGSYSIHPPSSLSSSKLVVPEQRETISQSEPPAVPHLEAGLVTDTASPLVNIRTNV